MTVLTRGSINRPLSVLLILAAVPIVGCSGGDLGPYRYRMTFEVNTPQGIRRGSSVIEVRSRATSRYSLKRGWTYHQVWGEAVTVDLPSDNTLYALLSRRPGGDVDSGAAVFAFIAIPPSKMPIDEKIPLFHARGGTGLLPKEFYPVLVRFRNHLKPETAEQVDACNFEQSFGKGYKINRIVTEITKLV